MDISAAIILAIAVFICLAIGIILFVIMYQRRVINHQIQMKEFNRQKEQELMQASIRSEEEERIRIAEELHDDVGATLSSVRLYLTQAARHPEDTTLIVRSKSLLDESIEKIRNLSHQLQPGNLQYLGLVKALQSFAEMIACSGAVHMEFVPNTQHWPEPDAQITLSIYRVMQELINNICKHSGASRIRLSALTIASGQILQLVHDGHGLNDDGYAAQIYKKGAIGLKNIERRLKAAGTTISFEHAESGEYIITLRLPEPSSAH